jgi:hypothetical protein
MCSKCDAITGETISRQIGAIFDRTIRIGVVQRLAPRPIPHHMSGADAENRRPAKR